MRRAIGIAFHGDGGHGDRWKCGELRFDRLVSGLALGETEAPAVVMDRDGDMVRIVESLGAAREGRVVELPLRRGRLPDQPGEIVRVFLVSRAAALGGEVELVPPGELGLGWER